MNKKLLLPLFAVYAHLVFSIVCKSSFGYGDSTLLYIFNAIFLYNESFQPLFLLSPFLFTSLLGFCFCAMIYISQNTYNISHNYLQMVMLRSKSKRSYFLAITRNSIFNAFTVILSGIIGLSLAIISHGLAAQMNTNLLLSLGLMSLNYLLFFAGLSVLCFLINLKYGNILAILATFIVLAVIILIDYSIPGFAILTAGSITQSSVGLGISAIWVLLNSGFAYFTIGKFDLI